METSCAGTSGVSIRALSLIGPVFRPLKREFSVPLLSLGFIALNGTGRRGSGCRFGRFRLSLSKARICRISRLRLVQRARNYIAHFLGRYRTMNQELQPVLAHLRCRRIAIHNGYCGELFIRPGLASPLHQETSLGLARPIHENDGKALLRAFLHGRKDVVAGLEAQARVLTGVS